MPKPNKRAAVTKDPDLQPKGNKILKPSPQSPKRPSSPAETTAPGPPPDSSDSDEDEEEADNGGIPLTEDNGTADEDESSDDDEEDDGKPLEVTFAFKDPTKDHFGAIRTMLRKFPCLDGQHASDLCDFLADQAQLGTMVVQEGGWENGQPPSFANISFSQPPSFTLRPSFTSVFPRRYICVCVRLSHGAAQRTDIALRGGVEDIFALEVPRG